VLGFRRRQVSATVAWQATALAAVAALVGVPAGVIACRVGWSRFAGSIGVVPTPSVPAWIALTAAASIVTANAIAYLPGRRAAALTPAEALRQE
jgi:putative ABC transport system permease protein